MAKGKPEIPKKATEKKPSRKAEITGKLLSSQLKVLAQQVHSYDENMKPQTKIEVLAKLVWDKAIGYVEIDPKTGKEKQNYPERWAIALLFDRLEGRVHTADKGSETRPLAEKISKIGKKSINKLTPGA